MRSVSPFEKYGQATPVTDQALQIYTFKSGDTLSGLAHRFYEDWTQWRLIADRNNLTDPRQIAPGTVLLIPQLPLQTGIFEVG